MNLIHEAYARWQLMNLMSTEPSKLMGEKDLDKPQKQ